MDKLADDFVQARVQTKGERHASHERRPEDGLRKECYHCGLIRHLAREYRNRDPSAGGEKGISEMR